MPNQDKHMAVAKLAYLLHDTDAQCDARMALHIAYSLGNDLAANAMEVVFQQAVISAPPSKGKGGTQSLCRPPTRIVVRRKRPCSMEADRRNSLRM